TIPRRCAASPSGWAPIGSPSCATASPTCGSSTTTISASSGSSPSRSRPHAHPALLARRVRHLERPRRGARRAAHHGGLEDRGHRGGGPARPPDRGGGAPGTPLAALPGIADTVLEAEVTPNRGDCLSVLGVAREVAAVSGARLRHPRPRPRESGAAAAREVRVRVEAADLCPRYCARVVRGVAIVPSPLWVRLRLRRAGMRALNAVVDATNYVMLERGQPLHAFDLERLAERRIVVRRGASGERLTTLDGVERALEPDDLVIADGRGPVALAGVMGGEASEVTPATRVLLLESAFFAPASVRRASRRLAL